MTSICLPFAMPVTMIEHLETVMLIRANNLRGYKQQKYTDQVMRLSQTYQSRMTSAQPLLQSLNLIHDLRTD